MQRNIVYVLCRLSLPTAARPGWQLNGKKKTGGNLMHNCKRLAHPCSKACRERLASLKKGRHSVITYCPPILCMERTRQKETKNASEEKG